MKRAVAILMVSMVVLGLLASGISCTKTVYITAPTPTLTESEIIANFLNDTHVNAMLWEEWNIFNEFNYGYSLYAMSGYSWSWYKNHWYNEEQGLIKRATENYNDIASVYPCVLITPFWDSIELAMKDLCEAMSPSIPYALKDFALRRAFQENGQAWLELSAICKQWNLEMSWPLPPLPSWPTPDSQW